MNLFWPFINGGIFKDVAILFKNKKQKTSKEIFSFLQLSVQAFRSSDKMLPVVWEGQKAVCS